MEVSKLFEKLPIKINKFKTISGGDINKAYFLETKEGNFFIKINQKKLFPKMLIKEANGLEALGQTGYIKTPKIINYGEIDQFQYLILEWTERGEAKNNTWENFGHALAYMHKIEQPFFGFKEDNYIGSLKQVNTSSSNWGEFYGQYHLIPLIKKLKEQNKIEKDVVKNVENLCLKLNEIFPKESPSLLHGDLWAGNYMVSKQQEILLIDPAVYNGHREIDLGMTRLFGGFPSYFYEAYKDVYPLDNNWEERLPFSQLYPLLVHSVLFGGYYVDQVKQILKIF